eukprot:Amastigsp_a676325_859.p3 type:complete len:220 gc:universal Amastigsp_a676325_859:1389-2048(+)
MVLRAEEEERACDGRRLVHCLGGLCQGALLPSGHSGLWLAHCRDHHVHPRHDLLAQEEPREVQGQPVHPAHPLVPRLLLRLRPALHGVHQPQRVHHHGNDRVPRVLRRRQEELHAPDSERVPSRCGLCRLRVPSHSGQDLHCLHLDGARRVALPQGLEPQLLGPARPAGGHPRVRHRVVLPLDLLHGNRHHVPVLLLRHRVRHLDGPLCALPASLARAR